MPAVNFVDWIEDRKSSKMDKWEAKGVKDQVEGGRKKERAEDTHTDRGEEIIAGEEEEEGEVEEEGGEEHEIKKKKK